MPRYRKSMFNNDHKLVGFTLGEWLEWRRFLRKYKLTERW